MSPVKGELSGPDLTQGVELAAIPNGAMLLGHAGSEPVLLVRRGVEVFAIGATCTHYGAPLAEGLVVGDTVRCPWHHACFNLRTGQALRPPALDPVARWRVEVVHNPAPQPMPEESPAGTIYVRERLPDIDRPPSARAVKVPESVLIVGGGAAGNAAAEVLRQEGYRGPITLLSADQSPPCDRPNLSKGYLAGNASDESNLLRPAKFYQDNDIALSLATRVAVIEPRSNHLELVDGRQLTYGALLLATGAEPIRLEVPGGQLPHVHYLRTLADSRALVSKALVARHAAVIGASFIGLEVAASLRARNVNVHVVGPEAIPMERILGAELGQFIRKLHEQHGVKFHLGTTVTAIDEGGVTLKNGERVPADLVVVGIGVRPVISLAERAGLVVDRGVTVDEYLQTSNPHIFAAGDIARWPDRLSGEQIRVEHFVVAERQGQTAARNILGYRERFDAVPFFWTEQYDLGIVYVGHAEQWDEVHRDGDLEARDCTLTYRRRGKTLAVATIHRDQEALRAEIEFEQTIVSGADPSLPRGPISAPAVSPA